jgi:hypothetical protein
MSLKSARFFITHSTIDLVRFSSSPPTTSCRTEANTGRSLGLMPARIFRITTLDANRSHHQPAAACTRASRSACCGVCEGVSGQTNSTWTRREGVRQNNALSCDCTLCACTYHLFACYRRCCVQLALRLHMFKSHIFVTNPPQLLHQSTCGWLQCMSICALIQSFLFYGKIFEPLSNIYIQFCAQRVC